MSFIAECTFCQGKIRVPEHAIGLSVPCPRCGNSFTLAAERKEPERPPVGRVKRRKKKKAPLAGMEGPRTPAVLDPNARLAQGDEPVPESYVNQALRAEQLGPLGPGGMLAPSQRVTFAGMTAFLCGSLALMSVQFSFLDFTTVPLCAVGLLAGLAGVLMHGKRPWSGLAPAWGGVALSAGVLLIIHFFPSLLALPPKVQPVAADTGPVAVVATKNKDKKAVQIRPITPVQWPSARRAAVQQGPVRVRVTKVENGSGGRLLITVRLINAAGGTRLMYNSWSLPRTRPAERPRLRDDKGHTYRIQDIDPHRPVPGQVRQLPLRPGKPKTDVLVFDAPTGPVSYLRLELPTTAFGQAGLIRLEIPGSMVNGEEP
jgi:hypothetical protein